MTKSHLNESQSSTTTPPPEICDVDGIISGLDFESFVLLPGTRNARPGMRFAEDAEAPSEEMGDSQTDYSASAFESPSMPSMYYYSPTPYWGSPFLISSSRIEGKKSRKNKNKKKNERSNVSNALNGMLKFRLRINWLLHFPQDRILSPQVLKVMWIRNPARRKETSKEEEVLDVLVVPLLLNTSSPKVLIP